jgi:hypothetical protein
MAFYGDSEYSVGIKKRARGATVVWLIRVRMKKCKCERKLDDNQIARELG